MNLYASSVPMHYYGMQCNTESSSVFNSVIRVYLYSKPFTVTDAVVKVVKFVQKFAMNFSITKIVMLLS